MSDNHAILVVEDDNEIRNALVNLLKEEGYEVLSASNGSEALDVLRRTPSPCMVLLDLMMPVMDGNGFLEERRKDPTLAPIPVAIITAGASVDRSRIDGAPVVPKPIRLPLLMSVIERFC